MDIEERMVEPYFKISHVKNLTKVLGIQKHRKRDVGISPKTLFCNVNFWFFSVLVRSYPRIFYHVSFTRFALINSIQL